MIAREPESRLQVMKYLKDIGTEDSSTCQVKVRFLTNYVLNGIEKFNYYHGIKQGLKVKSSFCDFNTFQQECLSSDSETIKGGFDFII